MKLTDIEKAKGHWILARMGKKVLRPGGKELTQKIIENLEVNSTDNVVEFAPGLGKTASLLFDKKLHSYVGIDADQEAVNLLIQKYKQKNRTFLWAKVTESGLASNSKDKVIGEAMLTMQADHRKSEIISEAHRILKPGGLYVIHELGLYPYNLSDKTKAKIQKELAVNIKVNARPLTRVEWESLLIEEGFKIRKSFTHEMKLLEPSRMIADEGLWRTFRIGFNLLTHPDAAKRIFNMRRIFKKYHNHLNAVAVIAEKI